MHDISQRGNFSIEMENIKMNQKEILEMKKAI